jgi:RNA binding exosome subunit
MQRRTNRRNNNKKFLDKIKDKIKDNKIDNFLEKIRIYFLKKFSSYLKFLKEKPFKGALSILFIGFFLVIIMIFLGVSEEIYKENKLSEKEKEFNRINYGIVYDE